MLASGCSEAEASREAISAQSNSVPALLDESTPSKAATTALTEAEDLELRRSYSAKEMKLHPCAKLNDDGSVTGTGCPSSLVVFGPYVSVPDKSEVQLRFDITSRSELQITSDMISNSAKQFHGALDELLLSANAKRSVSYRLHVFEMTRALEARIGLRAPGPIDFTITNLSLNVR